MVWIHYEQLKIPHHGRMLKHLVESKKWKEYGAYDFFYLKVLLLISHSIMSDFVTPWTAACQASLSFTISRSLLKFMNIKSMMLSNYLIFCCPSPLAFNLSQHQNLLQWVSSLNQVAKILELQLRHQSFHEYSGLISFRINWFDLLAVQGILKSLLQYHSSKAAILKYSAFFIVQLSHPYMTTGKTIALTRWTFVSKVTSLLFNALSRFVISFLLRSKHLLISWLQSLSDVILEPKKIKFTTVSIVSPFSCHEVMGTGAMILVFWMLSFKPAFSLSSFTFIKKL